MPRGCGPLWGERRKCEPLGGAGAPGRAGCAQAGGGDRHSHRVEAHKGLILAACRRKPALFLRELRDLLANGFPVRLHYRVELWTVGGWVNDLRESTEWDVVVRLDQLDRSYEVARLVGDAVTRLGRFQQFADAEQAVERPFRAPGGPVVPVLGIATCLTLMLSLPWETWVRLGAWFAVGLVIYVTYSHRRAAAVREAA